MWQDALFKYILPFYRGKYYFKDLCHLTALIWFFFKKNPHYIFRYTALNLNHCFFKYVYEKWDQVPKIIVDVELYFL